MKNNTKPKKIYKPQVHIIHSMMQMVKHKIKHEKWMKDRDLVEANVWLFEKIGESVQDNYQMVYSKDLSWQAAELYLAGLSED